MIGRRFLAVFLVVPAAWALSSADIASVFGISTHGLTGAATQLPKFVFSVFTNQTHALFSLNATSSRPSDMGWLGCGVGTLMADADMLVAWPNIPVAPGSPSWTLSHRQASGHVPPSVQSTGPDTATTAFYTLVPSLSTTDPTSLFTVVSFIRPLQMPPNYPGVGNYTTMARQSTDLIYASSSHRPTSNAEDAPIFKHDQPHASFEMDLSTLAPLLRAPVPAGGTVSPGAWSSESWPMTLAGGQQRNPLTRRDMILAAHATIGSIALLFFSPLAILSARYFRHLPWFRIHASIQLGAYSLIVVAFCLAISATKSGHFSNSHARLGLVIFSCLTAQLFVGWRAHKTAATSLTLAADGSPKAPTAFAALKGKPKVRLGHIAFGLGITILGWAQIRLGLEEWVEYSDSGNQVPLAVLILFWILIGVESAEVFFGRFLKEEMVHRARSLTSNSTYHGSTTTVSMARADSENTAGGGAAASMNWDSRPPGQDRDSDEATVVGSSSSSDSVNKTATKESSAA